MEASKMIIGIFSDAHGDLEAIRKALVVLQPAEKLFFLGDVHEFLPQVKQCIDLLQEHKVIAVKGNGDRHTVLDDKEQHYRKWLSALPKEYREGDMVFVHMPMDSEYFFNRENINLCFCGHTHRSYLISPFGQEKLLSGYSVSLKPHQQYIVGIGSISKPRLGEDKVAALFNTKTLELQLIKL
jgi:predicted phosphodiesterase